MFSKDLYGKILVPIVTPFKANGDVDFDAMVKIGEMLLAKGWADTFILTGTTGEFFTMSTVERIAVYEKMFVAFKGRIPMIAGTGAASTREALDGFRERVRAAGFPDLHFNVVIWGKPVLPGEVIIERVPELVRELGFDSVTSYVWIHHVELDQTPYTPHANVLAQYLQTWNRMEEQFDIPYFPNITMGWDNSPRTLQTDIWEPLPESTFSNLIGGNTPEAFRGALEIFRERLARRPGPNLFSINAWNEWTEGSYIEPDTVHGMGYLEAIADVFGPAARTRAPRELAVT
jgi:hypothetical protein